MPEPNAFLIARRRRGGSAVGRYIGSSVERRLYVPGRFAIGYLGGNGDLNLAKDVLVYETSSQALDRYASDLERGEMTVINELHLSTGEIGDLSRWAEEVIEHYTTIAERREQIEEAIDRAVSVVEQEA